MAALFALPYGLAIASLIGLPPVLGVFTSIVTAPVTAALGRNPFLIGGATSVPVPFIATAVRVHGITGAAKLSIVTALFMIAFGALRAGRIIARAPQAVLMGFSYGIGAMMLISQLDTLFGIVPAAAGKAGSPATQLVAVLKGIGGIRPVPLLLGMAVIVATTLTSKWLPRVPAPLVGVVAAVIIARTFGIHEREVGSLNAALPPLVHVSWRFSEVLDVLPCAFALAFVCSVNTLMASRVVTSFASAAAECKSRMRMRSCVPSGSPTSARESLVHRSA